MSGYRDDCSTIRAQTPSVLRDGIGQRRHFHPDDVRRHRHFRGLKRGDSDDSDLYTGGLVNER